MTKSERIGTYRSKKQQQNGNQRGDVAISEPSTTPQSHHLFRKRFVLLSLLFALLPHLYQRIDERIEGHWGSYPPLSFLDHPSEDFFLEFDQIVKKYGGNIEEHWVTTEDGYINKMFRINKSTPSQAASADPKPAILVVHGHLDSSDTFFVNGEKSLANQLMNAGYDVWLGNTRGNKYSERHETLDSINDYEYWHNSYPDSSAQYDMPAFLEKVISSSNVQKVTMICHSVATRNMIYNLVENGTYFEQRINQLVLLAPFTESHSCTFVNALFMYGNVWIDDYFPRTWKIFRSFTQSFAITQYMKWGCSYAPWSCDYLATQMSHTTDEFNDDEAQKVMYAKFPAQSSFKNWQMIRQSVKTRKFQKFDFGEKENQEKYGQATPPVLQASKAIHAGIPMFLIAAKHDILVNYQDQRRLYWQLRDAKTPDSAQLDYLEINGGHAVFMMGKDMSWVTNILDRLRETNPLKVQ